MEVDHCLVLCERSETEDAKEFHSFAIRYAPTVDSMSMAATFHDTLMEKTRGKRKLAVDPEEDPEEAEAEDPDSHAALWVMMGVTVTVVGNDGTIKDLSQSVQAQSQAGGFNSEWETEELRLSTSTPTKPSG